MRDHSNNFEIKPHRKYLTQLTQWLNVKESVKECSKQINSLNFSSRSGYCCLLKNSKTPPIGEREKKTQQRIAFKPEEHYMIYILVTWKSKQDDYYYVV